MPTTGCITPQEAVDFASRDQNRLDGSIVEFMARQEPYSDTIDGGTLENYSETMRVVVSEMPWSNDSMVRPQFVAATSAPGMGGFLQEVGNTEFTYNLGNARYRGPKIRVKDTRTAFADSYRLAVSGLRVLAKEKQSADIRAQYLQYGGCKLTIDSTGSFAQCFTGGINTLGDPTLAVGAGNGQWANRVPDSPLTHRTLEFLMSYMKETLGVQPFVIDGREVFKFIGSIETIQGFKDELGIGQDLRSMTSGRYSNGLEPMLGYNYDGPYRGIVHAVDSRPLRAAAVVSGIPTLEEPFTKTAVTTGQAGRPSTTWRDAGFEIGFLIGQQGFKRMTPTYQQVPGFAFPPQLVNGQMEFVSIADNDCNWWQDFGQHRWQVERAYKPQVPHAICAILYKRAATSMANFGVTPA